MIKKVLIFGSSLLFLLAVSYCVFINPRWARSANLTSISATLSNPRLSYKAGVTSGSSGTTLITIDGSGNPDNDTNHLFVKDSVCLAPSSLSGCKDDSEYTVATVASSTSFNVTPALTTALESSDLVFATQSGTLSLTFTLASDIPSNGDILITVPMADNQDGNDGFPDASGTTTSTGGFDLNSITTGDVSVTESCGGSFSVAAVNEGSGTTDHTIEINNSTAACAATSQMTITIGDSDHYLINPAPVTSGRDRGEAEIYNINVKTRDGSNNTLDSSDTLVGPVEGVFISETVDESLNFRVAVITADSGTYCNAGRSSASPDTTAYTIPWGTLSTTYLAATHNTQQQLTVTTNADAGYEVYIQENDQMGKDGATCSGNSPSSGDYTFSGNTCIRDTVCNGTGCTHVVAYDWGSDPSSYPGLGYSLQNQSGTDAEFVYSSSASPCDASASTGDFCAKQIADYDRGSTEEDETSDGAEIMSNADPVDGSSVYVCYRIDLPGTQPAGYYYSVIKYTAVATF